MQPNGTSWGKLEYVGQVGQGEGVLQILLGKVGQVQGVCPLEPVHLSQMGLQGRGELSITKITGFKYFSLVQTKLILYI